MSLNDRRCNWPGDLSVDDDRGGPPSVPDETVSVYNLFQVGGFGAG
jgi:hypothetical protein